MIPDFIEWKNIIVVFCRWIQRCCEPVYCCSEGKGDFIISVSFIEVRIHIFPIEVTFLCRAGVYILSIIGLIWGDYMFEMVAGIGIILREGVAGGCGHEVYDVA